MNKSKEDLKVQEYNKEDPTNDQSTNGQLIEFGCDSSEEEPKNKIPRLAAGNVEVAHIVDLNFNTNYNRIEFTQLLSKQWLAVANDEFKDPDSGVEIYRQPYQICLLPDLLENKDSCKELVKEMVEKVKWSRKQMDLYEFYQSTDLSNMINCQFLAGFLQMLRRTVRPWLEKITNLKLDYVSASCSMYTCGDYLLVHDDLLKDRQIAFIYYLTPWLNHEEWSEEEGGCLEIFNSDERCFPQFPVSRRISPKNNQFAFFKVGSKSFHQVGEVTTFDYPRLTINGWFHGASNKDLIADALRPFSKLQFQSPLPSQSTLELLLNEVYLKPTTKRSIQKRIEDNSEICLYEFFRREVFEEALKQLLNDKKLKWSRQGPANAQNYEVLNLKTTSAIIDNLIKLFLSTEMFDLLKDYTDLDMAGPNAGKPGVCVEVQRWSHGDYTVLGDGAICDENTLDLIYYLNAAEGAGVITYLSPDGDGPQTSRRKSVNHSDIDSLEGEGFDDEDDDESVLLTITSVDNALNIVYRCEVRLPSSGIMKMHEEPIRAKIQIGVFTFTNEKTQLLVKELTQQYKSNEIWLIEFHHIPYVKEASLFKTPAALEDFILKSYDMKEGDFLFIEWPKLQEDILITNERSALIASDCASKKIAKILKLYILQTHHIQQILAKDYKDNIKIEAPQAKYDIIISVLNPRPDVMNVKWNVPLAVETYLKPYLQQISHISNYTLKTQWKFQVSFEANLRQVRDTTAFGRHYALANDSLPYIITAIEKHLGVSITDKTPINLVVYVTPCDIAPVFIYNKRNERSSDVNAFISSKWGGLIIVNPPVDACKYYQEHQQIVSFFIQTNDIMQIMLYQLQKLLDINVEVNMDGVKIVDLEHLAPRRWEYESYIRRSTITHITTATNTLQSLMKLLNKISYIVIDDNVGALIKTAYEHISMAKKALANHQLFTASALAQKAFVASEQAFFDSSMLAQLYFPDEQKYAIYIPLFLPVLAPVVMSFSTLFKIIKNRNEKKN
uniref:uS12 prolyl 3-hydroxylase n=1 Tax=Glossina brevipalpis TaxID=37001 RepID=A0A1A9WRR7_9MUSC